MKFLKTMFLAAALAVGCGTPALADFIFQAGNNPGANEENILFGQHFVGVTNLVGFTNQTHAPIIFDLVPGTPMLGELAFGTVGQGQSDIVCNIGCEMTPHGGQLVAQLTDLEIRLGAGFGATDFIGNLDFGEGTFRIAVGDQFGQHFDYTLGNGQNFFTINAINNEVITDITIQAIALDGNGFAGWDSFKQPRISGVCTLVGTTCTAIPVPEPSSLSLMGFGLLGALWFVSRRRKSLA